MNAVDNQRLGNSKGIIKGKRPSKTQEHRKVPKHARYKVIPTISERLDWISTSHKSIEAGLH